MLCYYGVVSLYPTVNAVIFTWLGNRSCVLYQYQPLNRLDYNSRSQFACADMPRIDCRWQKADKFTRDSERERFATFIELKNAIHQSAFISITRILDDICRLSIYFFFWYPQHHCYTQVMRELYVDIHRWLLRERTEIFFVLLPLFFNCSLVASIVWLSHYYPLPASQKDPEQYFSDFHSSVYINITSQCLCQRWLRKWIESHG